MTYAAAVLIVENILRNATVLQGDREKIDLALAVLKNTGSLREEIKGTFENWLKAVNNMNRTEFVADLSAISPEENDDLVNYAHGDKKHPLLKWMLGNDSVDPGVKVSAEDISKGAQEAIQRHKDRIFAPSQQPVDDPNWPPAPEQKGPEGPM